MNRLLRNQKGMTLLEVMVGMLVFALGMLMLVPMVVTSTTGNVRAHETDMTMQDVQQIVEAFKARGVSASGSQYNEETHRYLTWWTEAVTANLEQLNVDVTWIDSQEGYHFRRVSTYVYRK